MYMHIRIHMYMYAYAHNIKIALLFGSLVGQQPWLIIKRLDNN